MILNEPVPKVEMIRGSHQETVLCHNDTFCCHAEYELTNNVVDNDDDQKYLLISFDGLRPMDIPGMFFQVQVCGVVTCRGDTVDTCSLQLPVQSEGFVEITTRLWMMIFNWVQRKVHDAEIAERGFFWELPGFPITVTVWWTTAGLEQHWVWEKYFWRKSCRWYFVRLFLLRHNTMLKMRWLISETQESTQQLYMAEPWILGQNKWW